MFTLQNTDGYTQEQLDEINEEFSDRWDSGEWAGWDLDDAEKAFAHEVAKR